MNNVDIKLPAPLPRPFEVTRTEDKEETRETQETGEGETPAREKSDGDHFVRGGPVSRRQNQGKSREQEILERARANPTVESAELADGELRVKLKDGSRQTEREGKIVRTSADGKREDTHLTERSAFTRKEAGQEIAHWEKDPKSGIYSGTFRGQDFEVKEGQVPALSSDGKTLLFLEPDGKVKGWWGSDKNKERVELLPNDLGRVVSVRDDSGARKTDVVLDPKIIERAKGGHIDLSAIPEEQLPKEKREQYEKYLETLPTVSGLADRAFKGETNTIQAGDGKKYEEKRGVESLFIRDGRMHMEIGKKFVDEKGKSSGDSRVGYVVDAKDDGVVAHTFNGDVVFQDRFSKDFKQHTFLVPDEDAAEKGQLRFRASTKEERTEPGGEWKQTFHQGIKMKDSTPSTGKLVLQSLGEVGDAVFSPFQSALYYTESAIWTAGSKAAGLVDGDTGALMRVSALYTARQAKTSEWLGKGTNSKDEMMDAYRAADEKLDANGQKTFHAYLDGEIANGRREAYGELYDLHRDDPITDEDRAAQAAKSFGLKNLSGQYFQMGRDALKEGRTGAAVASYAAGGFVIGGQAYVEGFGFGLAMKPLKAAAVAAGTGMKTSEVLNAAARASKGLAVGSKEAETAVSALKWMNRGEAAVFLTPAAAGVASSGGRLFEGWRTGNEDEALSAKEEMLASASGFLGAGVGLRRAQGIAMTDGEAEIFRTPPRAVPGGWGGRGSAVRTGAGTAIPDAEARALGNEYTLEVNKKGTADQPALVFQPRASLDHNGAFHEHANIPGRLWGSRVEVYERPTPIKFAEGQLQYASGKPIANLDQVAVYRGHGFRRGFAGISTRDAARMVAEEVANENQNRAPDKQIKYVALSCCMQGDRGYVVFGESNAQTFQRYLAEELAARGVTGHQPLTVLAAKTPGPLWLQQNGRVWADQAANEPATLIPADLQKPGISLDTTEKALIGVGAAGVAEGGLIIYAIASQKDKKAEKK